MKTDIIKILQEVGINTGLLLAGFLGGILSVYKSIKKAKKKGAETPTLIANIITIFSGGIMATYLTPLAITLFNVSGQVDYGIAFIIGYGGLVLMEHFLNKLGI